MFLLLSASSRDECRYGVVSFHVKCNVDFYNEVLYDARFTGYS